MPPHQALILHHLHSPEAVQLGAFVLCPPSPSQDFHNPKNRKIEKDDVEEVAHTGFAETLRSSGTSRFEVLLSSLLGAGYSRERDTSIKLKSDTARFLRVKNSAAVFEDVVSGDLDTRKWLEKAIGKGKDVYFVVGLCLVKGATYQLEDGRTRAFDAHAAVPARAVAPAGGGALGKFGLKADVNRSQATGTSFASPGELVFAVEYRKLRFNWYWSRNVDKAWLENGSRWKVTALRSLEEEEEDDVVEAGLKELQDGDFSTGTEPLKEELDGIVYISTD